jgi:hypothetical protein
VKTISHVSILLPCSDSLFTEHLAGVPPPNAASILASGSHAKSIPSSAHSLTYSASYQLPGQRPATSSVNPDTDAREGHESRGMGTTNGAPEGLNPGAKGAAGLEEAEGYLAAGD